MSKWLDEGRIHVGDCQKLLLDIFPGSVDLVFADPPFNIGYEYDIYEDRIGTEAYIEWTRGWIERCMDALKPNGTLWVAAGDEVVAEIKTVASGLGLILRNWVVWHYTFGVHCKKKFARSHTHLLYFVKSPLSFTFNDSDVRVPSARQAVYRDKRANSAGRVPDSTWILRPQDAPGSFSGNSDTWHISRVCGTFRERAGWHGCQMPVEVLSRVIRACSNPGELVLDPFAGSGTTLVAAKLLGRRWLGIELSPDYAARATERIESMGATACQA